MITLFIVEREGWPYTDGVAMRDIVRCFKEKNVCAVGFMIGGWRVIYDFILERRGMNPIRTRRYSRPLSEEEIRDFFA